MQSGAFSAGLVSAAFFLHHARVYLCDHLPAAQKSYGITRHTAVHSVCGAGVCLMRSSLQHRIQRQSPLRPRIRWQGTSATAGCGTSAGVRRSYIVFT